MEATTAPTKISRQQRKKLNAERRERREAERAQQEAEQAFWQPVLDIGQQAAVEQEEACKRIHREAWERLIASGHHKLLLVPEMTEDYFRHTEYTIGQMVEFKQRHDAVQKWREESGSKERFKDKSLWDEFTTAQREKEEQTCIEAPYCEVITLADPNPLWVEMQRSGWAYPPSDAWGLLLP